MPEEIVQRHVSVCCHGEHCWCGKPAEHKVEETIFDDDPTGWIEIAGRRVPARHPLTRYICHEHFVQLMGPAANEYHRWIKPADQSDQQSIEPSDLSAR